jgi:hypothetical protein
MRTGLFLLAGFLLLGACVIMAKLFAANYPGASTTATGVFIVLWLAITALNMWVGVNKAGYTAGEELPIFLLLFAVPAIVAVILKWKFI